LTINLTIGANTPPLCIDLMAACRGGETPLGASFEYLMRFFGVMIGVLLLLVLFLALITELPGILF